jgi:hypothetical protein
MILLTIIKGRWVLMLLDGEPIEEAALLEFDDYMDAMDAKNAWEGLLDD